MSPYYLNLIRIMGLFFLVFGFLFIFSPNLLTKINNWGKRTILSEEYLINHRLIVGIFLIIVSISILLLTFWFF